MARIALALFSILGTTVRRFTLAGLAIVCLAISPSTSGFALLALCLICDVQFALLAQNFSDIVLGRHFMNRHTRALYEGGHFYHMREIPIDDERIVRGFSEILGVKRIDMASRAVTRYHGNAVKPLYVFACVGRNDSPNVPPGLVSFVGINMPSLVFIYEEPFSSPQADFRLYHELAHAGWLALSSAHARYALTHFGTLVLLLAFEAPTHVLCVGLGLAMLRPLAVLTNHHDIAEELAADRIALRAVRAVHGNEGVAKCVRMLQRMSDAYKRFGGDYLSVLRAQHAEKAVRMGYHREGMDCGALETVLAFALLWLVAGTSLPVSLSGWSGCLAVALMALAIGALWYVSFCYVLGLGDRMLEWRRGGLS